VFRECFPSAAFGWLYSGGVFFRDSEADILGDIDVAQHPDFVDGGEEGLKSDSRRTFHGGTRRSRHLRRNSESVNPASLRIFKNSPFGTSPRCTGTTSIGRSDVRESDESLFDEPCGIPAAEESEEAQQPSASSQRLA
jgi:hypothetical protein